MEGHICVKKVLLDCFTDFGFTCCSYCLFVSSYEILHPELPCRERDHCGGHSESRVFDYFVPEFVLPSSYFLY
jgi:hypothetical protein